MSSIQTGIVLQDNFSNVAQGVIDAVFERCVDVVTALIL